MAEQLPDEIWYKIFNYGSMVLWYQSKTNQTNKKFRCILLDNGLWKDHFDSTYAKQYTLLPTETHRTAYQKLYHSDREHENALKLILDTTENVFITGASKTGKTTLLLRVIEELKKKCTVVVVTMDRNSAIRLEGSLLYEHLPPLYMDPLIVINMDVLVVDGIHMVNATHWDELNKNIVYLRGQKKPLRIIATGDFFQTPSSIEPCFSGTRCTFPITIELKIARMMDTRYAQLIKNIRIGRIEHDDLELLQTRNIKKLDVSIPLVLHSETQAITKYYNEPSKYASKGMKYPVLSCTPNGVHMHYYWITYFQTRFTELFINQRVILVAPIPEKSIEEGTVGIITELKDNSVVVRFDGDQLIEVQRCSWRIRLGARDSYYSQIPLLPICALSVNDVQYLNLKHFQIHCTRHFGNGEAYSLLSQARTIENVSLIGFNSDIFKVRDDVLQFYGKRQQPKKRKWEDTDIRVYKKHC